MIYITGDVHGNWISRLSSNSFPEGLNMTKNDYVIICGDFGIWDDSPSERYNLDWLDKKPFTTLVVDGNHENHDMLDAMDVSEWNGGKVHFLRPSVIHLMRGQVFCIKGIRFFTFGGASSHDISDGILDAADFPNKRIFSKEVSRWRLEGKLFRINHVSWWSRELPSEEEMEEGRRNLAANDNKVDFIITHCGSTSTEALLGYGSHSQDKLTEYFEEIKQRVTFKKWFMGHYHINKNVNAEEIVLYEQILRVCRL